MLSRDAEERTPRIRMLLDTGTLADEHSQETAQKLDSAAEKKTGKQ